MESLDLLKEAALIVRPTPGETAYSQARAIFCIIDAVQIESTNSGRVFEGRNAINGLRETLLMLIAGRRGVSLPLARLSALPWFAQQQSAADDPGDCPDYDDNEEEGQ